MKKLRKSVLLKYLFSYAGLVILCCLCVGLLLVFSLANLRKKTYQESTQDKINAVINDMEAQLDIFEDIALDMSISYDFSPDSNRQSKFYDLSITEMFANYRNYSSLSDEIFFFYHKDDELIYRASEDYRKGVTAYYSYFAKNRLGISDSDILRNDIISNDDFGIIPLSNYGGNEDMFLVYHNFYASTVKNDDTKRATVCHLLCSTTIDDRVTTISGGFSDKYALYLDEILLSSKAIEPTDEKNLIIDENKDGKYPLSIVVDIKEDNFYNIILGYQRVTLILFIVSVFVLLGMSIYLALRNYRPIKDMMTKYKVSVNDEVLNDELGRIDNLIDEARRNMRYANQKALEQMDLLKSQILLLLLGGIVSKDVLCNLDVLRDGLKGPFYKVLCIETKGICSEEVEELLNEIESCSTIDTVVYTCTLQKNEKVYVILSMKEDDSGYFINELIKEICEAKGHSCIIGESTSKTGIDSIHNSYLQAINALKLSKNEMDNTYLSNSVEKAGKEMAQIVGYINDHYLEWDLSLEKIANIFSINSTCLSNTFKSETGVNYKSYIIGLRIKEAKRLLRETDISITDICHSVGYSSLSSFIIKFKEMVGSTPNQYRRKMENFKIL